MRALYVLTLLCPLWLAPVAQAWAQDPVPAVTPSADNASNPGNADDAADNATPDPATTRRSTRTARPPVSPRFELDITAPDALRELLTRHLDVQRFRLQRSLDAAELDRLLLELPANARELLATQGYFAPTVTLAPLQPPSADAQAAAGEGPAPLGRIGLTIVPGPATRVASVQVTFLGDVANDVDATAQREEIRADAAVLEGRPFTQDSWDQAKTATLRRLTALRYPNGRITTSLADVDAQSASARLYIELDSGPRRRFGAIEVDGAQRYDAQASERIVRLAGLTPGNDYDLAALQRAQQRLIDSGLYDAAFVYVEPDASNAPLAVKVQLREATRQKLVLGIGGSTDNGARLSIEHTHNRMPVLGWRALSTLRLERKDSLLSTAWDSPLNDDGWRWISLLQAARQEDDLVTTTSQRARFGQAQDGEEFDRSVYLQYDRAQTVSELSNITDDGANGRIESSITANVAWSRQRFDDIISPQQGYGLGLELGAGTTLGIDRKPFARVLGRWLGVLPLGDARPSVTPGAPSPGPRLGRLALRLESGAVIAREDTPVPDTQLFLTGGDNSVRGYGLRAIGVPQADGTVRAGRFKTVASLEWQRPIGGDGLTRSALEHVLFIDGGAVANRVRDLDMQWGVGTGLRYNSPVGPLQIDLAYGLEPRQWRLHFAVGFVF
ncbi:MAG: BamA/TamA family outer membrane protein [Hydrogenophaga sp.]|nr:BamA/TamA family outer membrane protein [Hydrogenophaga sp.]